MKARFERPQSGSKPHGDNAIATHNPDTNNATALVAEVTHPIWPRQTKIPAATVNSSKLDE